jgi:hypothetical protein
MTSTSAIASVFSTSIIDAETNMFVS